MKDIFVIRFLFAFLLVLLLGCSASRGGGSSNEADSGTDGTTGDSTAFDTGDVETTGPDEDIPPLPEANPEVELTTNMGVIVLELDTTLAPNTVANFVSYVSSGHYDGTIFHRVIENFMIQGGGFDQSYTQKPTEAAIENEATLSHKNLRGTIAMARTNNPHSATTQFFINVVDNNGLNHTAQTPDGWGYAVFGKVIEGMDVVDAIRVLPTGAAGPFSSDAPKTQVIIEKAVVRE